MYKLPDLPYNYSALEPYIDEQTMKLHHDKHHAGYVDKLNKALEENNKYKALSIEDLLSKASELPQNVINNGGGHANHSLFWEIMGPSAKAQDLRPSGKLAEAIKSTFGDLAGLKEKFIEKAMGVFGSGWAFLEVDKGKLNLKKHSFQNSPLMHGKTPILGLDVWEHAYYLKYQNRRADYIKAFWNVVNWDAVAKKFT
jgi:Fe-Mn family superoxide dismutase